MLITKQADLIKFVEDIKDSPYLAIDTEFHRERTYFAQLCLIQIATDDHIAAIDPLIEDLDLTPLYEHLKEDKQVKVFHACKQDLEIFFYEFGKIIGPIFDTQIAAMALGLGEQISYANLVHMLLKRPLNKAQQMTDWRKRPLTNKQLDYALDDVRYLRKIYQMMDHQLEAKNRKHWLDEEMRHQTSQDSIVTPVNMLWKKVKMRDKTPSVCTALRELTIWREDQARKKNLPRSFIVKDDMLSSIARYRPKAKEELLEVRGVTDNFVRQHGDAIIEAIEKAKKTPEEDWARLDPRPQTHGPDSLVAQLAQTLLRQRAMEENVMPRLIASNDELEKFLSSRKHETLLDTGWRWDLVGKDLDMLKRGKLALGVKGRKMVVYTFDEEQHAQVDHHSKLDKPKDKMSDEKKSQD